MSYSLTELVAENPTIPGPKKENALGYQCCEAPRF